MMMATLGLHMNKKVIFMFPSLLNWVVRFLKIKNDLKSILSVWQNKILNLKSPSNPNLNLKPIPSSIGWYQNDDPISYPSLTTSSLLQSHCLAIVGMFGYGWIGVVSSLFQALPYRGLTIAIFVGLFGYGWAGVVWLWVGTQNKYKLTLIKLVNTSRQMKTSIIVKFEPLNDE